MNITSATAINAEASRFLNEQLRNQYHQEMPHLKAVIHSGHTCGTFVNPLDKECLTCDVNLVCSRGCTVKHGPELLVVETNTAQLFLEPRAATFPSRMVETSGGAEKAQRGG